MEYTYLRDVSTIGLNKGDAYVHGAHNAIECLKTGKYYGLCIPPSIPFFLSDKSCHFIL